MEDPPIETVIQNLKKETTKDLSKPLLKKVESLIFNANYLFTQNRYDDSIKIYNKILLIVPISSVTLYNKGVTLLYLKKYDEAIKLFDDALKIDPNDIKVISNKGVTLIYLKKYDEAIRLFDDAFKIDPNNLKILSNKGGALSQLKKDN